jgi:hypothetical protein
LCREWSVELSMPFIDYAEVRRRVTMVQVLDLLHYTLRECNGERGRGRCPLSCIQSAAARRPDRCASFDLAKNHWRCHACTRGGNHLDLYAALVGESLYCATLRLCGEVGMSLPILPNPRKQRNSPK